MRTEPFPSLAQLLTNSNEAWGGFETEEAAFLDACLNGEFHEEGAELHTLGDRLTDVQLASLFLPVCHGLVAGTVENREGDGFEAILRCYTQLDLWQRKRLESTETLLASLADVRKLVFVALNAEKSLWWFQIWEAMRILEFGVRSRMGLSPLGFYGDYSKLESKLD